MRAAVSVGDARGDSRCCGQAVYLPSLFRERRVRGAVRSREGRGRSLSGTDHREVARYWAGLPLLVRLSEAGDGTFERGGRRAPRDAERQGDRGGAVGNEGHAVRGGHPDGRGGNPADGARPECLDGRTADSSGDPCSRTRALPVDGERRAGTLSRSRTPNQGIRARCSCLGR